MRGKDYGFSVIELLIVICVVAIIAALAGIEYSRWISKYRVEREIREMRADLVNARGRAMMRYRMHFVTLTTTGYSIYEDTYDAGAGTLTPDGDHVLQTASDNRISQTSLNSRYPITWSGTTAQVDFNQKGFAQGYCSATTARACFSAGDCPAGETCSIPRTICSNTNFGAEYTCIVIDATRISLGRLTTSVPDGGSCDTVNCRIR